MAKITGVERAKKRIANLLSTPEKIDLVSRALYVGADEIAKEAKHYITLGAVSGAGHKASSPGSPPNENTGGLRNGIITIQIGPLHAQVQSTSPYGAIQELGGTINHPGGTAYFVRGDGTAVFVSNDAAERFSSLHGRELPRTKPHQITLPERPYLGPAARAKRKEVVKIVKDAIKVAIGK